MKTAFRLLHHVIAHPLIGLSIGRLWAWRFHDWTGRRAWPGSFGHHPRHRGLS